MKRKIIKISRYLRYRLKPASHIPLFWHIGRPNFGDDINPTFFEALAGTKIRFARDQTAYHFLGMGSILDRATETSVCLGSGVLDPATAKIPRQIISLRGELSKAALGLKEDIPLGDPMVLIDRFIKPERSGPIGLIPHVNSVRDMRVICPRNIKVIDPSMAPWRVIKEIAQCSRIMSQSLHGLIVADALEIPNIWLAPSKSMTGGRFKFDDYFSTLDSVKDEHSANLETFINPPFADFSVSQYIGQKKEYHRLLQAALTEGLFWG